MEGVDILNVISKNAELLVKFGGHQMAAGLTIQASRYAQFKELLTIDFQKAHRDKKRKRKKSYDVLCPVKTIMSDEYLDFMKLLEPFGPGNPQPVFQDSFASIVNSRTVGRNNEHLHLTIRGKYSNLKGIGFSLGSRINEVQETPQRPVVFTPTKNRFRGTVSWQVRVIDL